jgi:hypothetical protein
MATGVAKAAAPEESEPNDDMATATPLAAGDVGTGAVAPVGDRDFWITSGATPGQQIFALVETAQSSSGDDAVLAAYDDEGAPIAQDDDDGPGAAPAIGGHPFAVGGDVVFEVHDAGDDATITPYRLFQRLFDPSAAIVEIEPNDTLLEALAVPPGSLIAGSVSWVLDVDLFAVPLASGQELAVVLDRDPDDSGLLLPSLVDLLDASGATLASADAGSGDAQGVGPITASVPGTYYVRITESSAGAGAAYRMALLTSVPEPGALASGVALATLGCIARRAGRRRAGARPA